MSHLAAQVVQLFEVGVVQFAKEILDARLRGTTLGWKATVQDHIMRPLLESKVFATEIPSRIHQLHGVKRAAF
jgi:hypothetical protein